MDRPTGTGFFRSLSRSKSRDREEASIAGTDSSKTQRSNSYLSRMTSSTETSHEAGSHQHHPGALDKLKGVFSNRPSSRDRHGHAGAEEGMDRNSLHTTSTAHDGERGRHMHGSNGEPMVSTGRGGAGNIRASSRTRAPDATELNEEEARERSRERSRDRGLVGGRGGAGNFRSASKQPGDRVRERLEEEEAERAETQAQERRAAEEAGHVKSHGRGGAGNIAR